MEFIICDQAGVELGFLSEYKKIDFDIGELNDFEITISEGSFDKDFFQIGNRIISYKTEYGGIIKRHQVSTTDKEIVLCGYTWRGMLGNKVIEPPTGEAYRIVAGDANTIIDNLISSTFDGIIIGSDQLSGIQIKKYQFDRYCTLLDGLQKMLKTANARLDIKYNPDLACVVVSAVSIIDYSEMLEYSQDNRLNFSTDDYQMGTNHLICLGQGELTERQVIHLYVQEDGTVGKTQFYKGVDEIEETYDYSSVESLEELEKAGTEKLLELTNYKSLAMSVAEIDAEIGDIVGGRERITGMYAKKPIISKIFRVEGRNTSVEFKLEGSD